MCLDACESDRPVLEAGARLAQLLGVAARAVHVREGGVPAGADPVELAGRHGLSVDLLEGPVAGALLRELASEAVGAAVMGARATVYGRRPVGSVTRRVIHRSPVPILVVPPEAPDPGRFRTALVPVDGTARSSGALREWLPRLVGRLELVGLHVFTPESVPAMLDRPRRDMLIIVDAFHQRHLPGAGRVEMRPGDVASQVVDFGREQGVDLLILSWKAPEAIGRGQNVLGVLALSPVPTLLLPAGPPRGRRPSGADAGT